MVLVGEMVFIDGMVSVGKTVFVFKKTKQKNVVSKMVFYVRQCL